MAEDRMLPGQLESSTPEPQGDGRHRIDLLRIIDANTNRAAEGLRVLEDFSRFALDDAHLTECFKATRHDLASALGILDFDDRHCARQVPRDVGTRIAANDEYSRASMNDVIAANAQRVQQSLRCLEEYGKMLDASFARTIEPMRYRVYSLHQALHLTCRNRDRFNGKNLYAIIDGGDNADDFARRASALLNSGVNIVQLRDKSLGDRELVQRGRQLAGLIRSSDALFIMNDRPDLAVLCGADGVHCGQEELCVRDARRIAGPEMIVGISTHSMQQARQAVLNGADYIGCGPTFPSHTKQFESFPGLDYLRAVRKEIRLPAFAVGGIDTENLPGVLETGFSRIAMGNAIWNSPHIEDQILRVQAQVFDEDRRQSE